MSVVKVFPDTDVDIELVDIELSKEAFEYAFEKGPLAVGAIGFGLLLILVGGNMLKLKMRI